MKLDPKSRYFVYALLRNDTNEIFYVGITKDLEDRMICHWNQKGGVLKSNIIKKLRKKGYDKIQYKVLASGLSARNACKLEVALIKKYGRILDGTGILANNTEGGEIGEGIIFSQESRRRMSESKKGHTPWNKGTKGIMVAWNKGLKGSNKVNKTTFKKGQAPWNKGLTVKDERVANNVKHLESHQFKQGMTPHNKR